MNLERFFQEEPFAWGADEKNGILSDALWKLTEKHRKACEMYRRILEALPNGTFNSKRIDQVPTLPIGLFKRYDLKSVSPKAVVRVLTSSGTTSQTVSRIFLDKETSVLQTKALTCIMRSFIGPKRLPMILVDSQNVLERKDSMNARGAGLVGLSLFGRDHFYMLDESMRVRWEELGAFLKEHAGEKILIFGFTSMIWQYFLEEARAGKRDISVRNGLLVHGGGWKKLQSLGISNDEFKKAIRNQFQIEQIHNFYGMAEQVGSIFMECERGYLHVPNCSDIIIRDGRSLEALRNRKKGIIQVLSVLPQSYPGHSLLTEDEGMIEGEDDCRCGRKGKYFQVLGRLPQVELRGCSDVYAYGESH
ncbi:MAG: acyl-protein synthetase [Candidatus Omnitrophica bacterium]|nr:acyl-protein synthetase [Candidatus Omnitrophota bacterium]